jgi:5-methylcytosine-specific restriction endonuclease McrA
MAFDNLMSNDKVYYWETPEYKKRAENARLRNMHATQTYKFDSAYPFPKETLKCVWCGKEFEKPRKGKHFCSPNRADGQQQSDCYLEFFSWWCSIPRFKRVVFLRDNFTCQICGLKPTWTNNYGLILPDLSKLAVDHIHPFAKGGKTEFSNLQCLCRPCNYKKRDKINWKPSLNMFDNHSKIGSDNNNAIE